MKMSIRMRRIGGLGLEEGPGGEEAEDVLLLRCCCMRLKASPGDSPWAIGNGWLALVMLLGLAKVRGLFLRVA